MKFRFRLDPVLKLRQQESEEAYRSLARALQASQHQEEQVEHARRRLEMLLAEAQGLHQTSDPRALQRRDAYVREARGTLQAARRQLEQLRHREAQARAWLATKKKAEEALLMLREQEEVRFKRALEHADRAALDEQAVNAFNRKQQSSS